MRDLQKTKTPELLSFVAVVLLVGCLIGYGAHEMADQNVFAQKTEQVESTQIDPSVDVSATVDLPTNQEFVAFGPITPEGRNTYITREKQNIEYGHDRPSKYTIWEPGPRRGTWKPTLYLQEH